MSQQPPLDIQGDHPPADADDPDLKTRPRTLKVSIMRIVIIIAAVYVAVCVLVYIFQARMIYFPSREYECSPADVGLDYELVALATSDGLKLSAWYIAHDDAIGSAIFCHGNAGNISHRLATIKALNRRMKLNVLVFDYRGFGQSEGRPDEPGLYKDAQAAWDYLVTTKGESSDRVVLIGRSLGGAVAIDLAKRHEPAALLVESTFTSLIGVAKAHYGLLPVDLLLRHRYESIDKIGDLRCPKLFFHGLDDSLVPFQQGRELFEAAGEPKQFIETPGGHNDAGFLYNDEYLEKTRVFLESVLSKP